MKLEAYCDESRPDLLASKKPQAKYMVIGSVWLCTDDRDKFKQKIHSLRDHYRIGGEFKWQKASPSRIEFYKELISWFLETGDSIRFRCVAVDHKKANLIRYHDSDQELGFYKFYYQLLHHWIMDFNEYAFFCDGKKNHDSHRLDTLKRCLNASNLSSFVSNVQEVRSSESVLIQLADVLTGIASSKLNNTLCEGSAKSKIAGHLESKLGRTIRHTYRNEKKFNVFVINLEGGW